MRVRAHSTTKSLMVMGTASDVGKSALVTGLCRLLARSGVQVAPFKAQNMSNNAAVCPGGGEIGRAQAVQAEACGLEPTTDMNPVLLKPDSENSCQVVINGRARFQMTTRDYGRYRRAAWPEIVESYNRLAAQFDLIFIEGAGGAAEVNLRDRDVVNWPVAEVANAPVLIVADIDKGGALAALVGTIDLLSPTERARVEGLVINKFRGDRSLLSEGLRTVEEKTGIPILGVLPYIENLQIPREDSASLKTETRFRDDQQVRLGVVRFPRISNYTDFDALASEPDVDLRYLECPEPTQQIDLICLPGTKSTIADLAWLRETGWERYIIAHYCAGGSVLGICGGYQMLGRVIADPHHVESAISEITGLGLLHIHTQFEREKTTALVRAIAASSGMKISGYEIHCGRIASSQHAFPFTIYERDGHPGNDPEGALSADGRVLGTSIHGCFDSPGFRRHYLNLIRARRGLLPLDDTGEDAKALRSRAYDRWADLIADNLKLESLEPFSGLVSADPPGPRTVSSKWCRIRRSGNS